MVFGVARLFAGAGLVQVSPDLPLLSAHLDYARIKSFDLRLEARRTVAFHFLSDNKSEISLCTSKHEYKKMKNKNYNILLFAMNKKNKEKIPSYIP